MFARGIIVSSQRKLKQILSGVSLSAVLLAFPAGAETLQEALEYTYVANPTILSQRQYVSSVYEKIAQSKAGYKPTVTGDVSYGYQYTRSRTSPLFAEEESKPVSFGVNAVQSLFSGFQTSASVKAAKARFEAEIANLNGVEQSTLTDAVAAYTGVIRDVAIVKLHQNNEAVLKRQLEYTRDRFRVGELTKTDVAQADARYAAAVSGRIAAEGNLKIAYAVYQKVIGKLPEKIFEPEVPAAKLPQTLDDAIDIAMKSNPAVTAAEKNAQSAESSIQVAQSGYYPTLDVQAGYRNTRAAAHGSMSYIDSSGALASARTGRAREEDTSVMLVMNVPFYRAGTTVSKVREAKRAAGQAGINVMAVKRDVSRATTQAWENYQATRSSLSAMEEQVKASALALDGVKYEEQAGERTVLDILNAEQELLDARVNVVTAKKNLIDAAYNLIASMGLMTPAGLELDLEKYRKNPIEKTAETREDAEENRTAEQSAEKTGVENPEQVDAG